MEDPQIAELKELVRQNIAISTETNKILHHMRTGARVKSFFWLLVFAASIASSIYSYYYFIAPRINQIKNIYETNVAPLQGAGSAISDFMKKFGGTATTTQ